jgi:hypothetical protein
VKELIPCPPCPRWALPIGIDEHTLGGRSWGELRWRRCKGKGYRRGGEYIKPPSIHSAFLPRGSPNGVEGPTLRAKISP